MSVKSGGHYANKLLINVILFVRKQKGISWYTVEAGALWAIKNNWFNLIILSIVHLAITL